MLVVSRRFTVFRPASPPITFNHDIAASEINHRLYSQAHAVLDYRAGSPTSVIRHLRIFMHFSADAMAAHLAHHGITLALNIRLDCIGDIADTAPFTTGGNSLVERLLRGKHELHHLFVNFSHGESVTHVAIEAVKLNNHIKPDYVTLLEGIARRESMHDDLVDLNTDRTGEAAVAKA